MERFPDDLCNCPDRLGDNQVVWNVSQNDREDFFSDRIDLLGLGEWDKIIYIISKQTACYHFDNGLLILWAGLLFPVRDL